MKLKTLIILPFLIAALIYTGAKGYIYYKTKSGLDKLKQIASPVVQIDYTDVGSKLTGTITIDNVQITPTGTYDEITIKQLSISGDGLNFLFELTRGFNSDQFPSKMTIAFEKLQTPVSSSFLTNITPSFQKGSTKKRKIKTCSILGILNAVGLKELEQNTITMDGSVGYIYDKEANQAEFRLKYDLANIESTLLDASVSQLSSQAMLGIGKLPVIDEFKIVRKFESDYITKIVSHCATEASLSTSAFIDDLFTQSDNYYLNTLGFVPGPGLSDLFRQLITNAGTVEITAAPSSEISPALLKAYRPEDLIDLFGVTASYNGKQINDLSFSMQSSSPKRRPKQTTSNNIIRPTPAITTTTTTEPTPKPVPKLRYLDTELADLKNYINYKVRIFTLKNDIPKQGMLISIINNTINVQHLLFSGKMTSHIHKDRIDRIEVLRKEKPEDK